MAVDIEACKPHIPPSKFDLCMSPFSSILLNCVIPLLGIAIGIFFCGILIYMAQSDQKNFEDIGSKIVRIFAGFFLVSIMMALIMFPVEESDRYRVERSSMTQLNSRVIFINATGEESESEDDVPLWPKDE